jgi:hypothetical protein
MAAQRYELVLNHRYGESGFTDRSRFGNDGFGELRLSDGRDGSERAAVLDGVRDRIYVPPSSSLMRPGAVRTALVATLDELGQRRTLVEGYLSFAFHVESDGSIGAGVLRFGSWHGIRSSPNAISVGTWHTFEFGYTDAGVMSVLLDGVTVAEAVRSLGEADGVSWPFGLNIGAWPDADLRLFKGRIAEVRLWRGVPSGDP